MRKNASPSSQEKEPAFKKSTLFCIYARPYWRPIAVALLSIFGAAGVVLGFGRIIKDLIDTGSVFHPDFSLELILASIFACVFVLALCSFGRSYYVAWLSERMMTDVRLDVFKHLLSLDIGYLEHVRTGELVSRLTTDANLIQILIGNAFPLALRNGVLVLGGLVMMMLTSAKLTVLSLVLVPILLMAGYVLGHRVRTLSKKTQEKIGELGAFLDEVLLNIRTCYAFTNEANDIDRFHNEGEEAFKASANRNLYRSILSSFIMSLAFAGIVVLLYIGIKDVHGGHITSGVLSSFMFYAILVAGSAGSFSDNYADFKKASGAADRLIDLMYIRPSMQIPAIRKRSHLPSRGTLAVHNVDFAYPSSTSATTLNKISFTINPGEKVAIVGPSGAGKSTLFALLMRFYDPQSGTIYIDGQNYKDMSPYDIRHRVGLVPQDPALFSASLLENILYGNNHASPEEIAQAIRIARLSDVIASLPQGLHTYVGPRGIRLSGGQKQRVAIARAILRNPVLLLLDEATSALDAENEHAVQEGLKYLTTTRSTLVIAHRLSTVLHAERIIVMDKGVIQGIGTHAELCETNALYRRLATLQFFDTTYTAQSQMKE